MESIIKLRILILVEKLGYRTQTSISIQIVIDVDKKMLKYVKLWNFLRPFQIGASTWKTSVKQCVGCFETLDAIEKYNIGILYFGNFKEFRWFKFGEQDAQNWRNVISAKKIFSLFNPSPAQHHRPQRSC